MRCDQCRELLDARLDGELVPDQSREIDVHLEGCAVCGREYATRVTTHRLLSENLVRYTAPDTLKARLRSALAQPDAFPATRPPRSTSWIRLAAAGIVVAAASSLLTLAAVGRPESHALTDDLLASHVRSLMPGHLTDVVATNQHLVKPWFNGRVDLSPSVPNLDSAGFPLVGGRADYVNARTVPVVVYARRQHLINVYAFPIRESDMMPAETTRNGYNFIHWRRAGVDYWAVSDVNVAELRTFVSLFRSG
jgi:anti-sigma factor RsiW